MTLTDLITNITYALKGTDDNPPSLGDDDWIYWSTVANRKKNEMYDDSKKKWGSAFKPAVQIGVITAGTNNFNLTGTVNGVDLSTFMYPGKKAYILRLDGTYEYIEIVKPQNARLYKHQVVLSGQNPQVLSLSWIVQTAENNVGGTLYLPGFFRPPNMDITLTTSYVPVDDPNWLAMATAAQIAFNDITYDDKFGDLNGQANILYQQMSHKNKRIVASDNQATPYDIQRIPGFR